MKLEINKKAVQLILTEIFRELWSHLLNKMEQKINPNSTVYWNLCVSSNSWCKANKISIFYFIDIIFIIHLKYQKICKIVAYYHNSLDISENF